MSNQIAVGDVVQQDGNYYLVSNANLPDVRTEDAWLGLCLRKTETGFAYRDILTDACDVRTAKDNIIVVMRGKPGIKTLLDDSVEVSLGWDKLTEEQKEAISLGLPNPELPKPELPKPELPNPELPKPELPKPVLSKNEYPILAIIKTTRKSRIVVIQSKTGTERKVVSQKLTDNPAVYVAKRKINFGLPQTIRNAFRCKHLRDPKKKELDAIKQALLEAKCMYYVPAVVCNRPVQIAVFALGMGTQYRAPIQTLWEYV